MSPKKEKRSRMLLRPVQQAEELARQEFARTRGDVHLTESRIRACEQALAVQDAFARRAILAGGPAAGMAFYRQCVGQLRDEMTAAREKLDHLNLKLQTQRRELVRLMKQRKVLERLIERLATERATDESRLATKELDQTDAAQRNWRSTGLHAWQMDPGAPGLLDPAMERQLR